MKNYLKLLRIHHYIKNILIFVPLLCSGTFFESNRLLNLIVGFLSFCLISSVVYIVNDINDIEKDKKHPIKRNRPIASGKISKTKAKIIAVVLFSLAIIINLFINDITSTVILLIYFTINLMYSMGLKKIPIVDIFLLASGFILRLIFGSIISAADISSWLYLTVFSLSFFFALGKRRGELRNNSIESRESLEYYSENFLNMNMYVCMTMAIIFYALWARDAETITKYNNKYLVFTVPVVLLITMRYSFDIEDSDSDGDPINVLISDKLLIAICVIYILLMLLLLYMA